MYKGLGVRVGSPGKVVLANALVLFFERAFDLIEMGAYSKANLKVVG